MSNQNSERVEQVDHVRAARLLVAQLQGDEVASLLVIDEAMRDDTGTDSPMGRLMGLLAAVVKNGASLHTHVTGSREASIAALQSWLVDHSSGDTQGN